MSQNKNEQQKDDRYTWMQLINIHMCRIRQMNLKHATSFMNNLFVFFQQHMSLAKNIQWLMLHVCLLLSTCKKINNTKGEECVSVCVVIIVVTVECGVREGANTQQKMFWIIHSCHQWKIERGIHHKSQECCTYQKNCLVGSSLRFKSVLLPSLELPPADTPAVYQRLSSEVGYMLFSTHISWKCKAKHL